MASTTIFLTAKQPNEAQDWAIAEAIANFKAHEGFELDEWKVVDGGEYSPNADPLSVFVEFRYRCLDPEEGDRVPGREVHVYDAFGKALDVHDFG